MAQLANSATGSAMSVHPSGHESQSSVGRGRGRGRRFSSVSTLVGESIIARRIYRGCTITVCGRQTSADLVELEMLDFDAIMGMEWLAACYAIVDCREKIARFQFSGKPVLEWVGNTATPRGRFIFYLKARKMIAKGCIYHIVRVKDVDAEKPTLQSIPIVKEYVDIFPDELPGIPPEREIDFGIDLLPGTQPISIPPYRMAPAELKELKEQLKDLLEKGKANVIADALSRRSMGSLAHVEAEKRQLTREIHQLAYLGVRLVESGNGGVVLQNTAKSSLKAEVKERQYEDPELVKLRERVPQQKKSLLGLKGDGVLRYKGRLCVLDVVGLRDRIMSEAHYSWFSIHPGSTKMYHDIKEVYWWNDMKKNIAEYVAQYPSYQQVKIEHQKPGGLMQTIEIPTWKWEAINMDFITGLPRSNRNFDSIWVIVDKLTKLAHFLPVISTYITEDYAKLYIKEIMQLHEVPVSIISDRGAQFIAHF
ncbi:uncharacterized protein [Nicotiana sylvestris]|uniref:uncharacterized protein n=1 Tax=Nicotiana sylvestris TaxID=4096 RepID=UPI00388C8A54